MTRDELRDAIRAILIDTISETGDDYWGHEITGIDEAADAILAIPEIAQALSLVVIGSMSPEIIRPA